MHAYHSGYTFFTRDAGTTDQVDCKVCGAPCDRDPDRRSPSSYATAMALRAGRLSEADLPLQDHFTCPHAHLDWHRKACQLAIERDSLHSPSLRAMVDQDLQNLLNQHR